MFLCYIKQIMNVFHSCDGAYVFIRLKMKCSFQSDFASLKRPFYLSPYENICTTALILPFTICILFNKIACRKVTHPFTNHAIIEIVYTTKVHSRIYKCFKVFNLEDAAHVLFKSLFYINYC